MLRLNMAIPAVSMDNATQPTNTTVPLPSLRGAPAWRSTSGRDGRRESLLTAIFGSLAAGDYVVWQDATTRGPVVSVPEGGVAELRLD
jgi:hypothetical protein